MKKLLSLLLVAVLLLGLVAGCSNSSQNDTANNDSQGTTNDSDTQNDTNSEEPYQVNMVITLPATAPDAAAIERVTAAINEITLPALNMTLSLEVVPYSMYLEQIPLRLSSGSDMDIFTAFSALGPSWVNAGYVLDMNDYLDEYGPDIIDTYASEDLARVCSMDGFLYGLPVHKEIAQQPTIFFRTDILEKHNIDVSNVKTLADVDAIFEEVSKLEPDMWMLSADNTAQGKTIVADFLGTTTSSTCVLNPESSTEVVNLIASDEFYEWCSYNHKWFENGWINPGAASDTESYYTYIASGQAFAFFSDYGHPISEADQEANCSGTDLTMVQMGEPYCNTGTSAVFCYCIGAGSKDPAKAMQMLNLIMTSPEIMNLLNWGEEGVDYVVNEDGLLDFPEGVDESNVGYHLNAGWILPNQFMCTPWCTSDPDIYEQIQAYNETAVVSKSLGFVFDPAAVADEVTAVTNVRSKYYKALIVGAVDPDEYIPMYLEELEAAGHQKIIDEVQRQLDEFLANKA